MDISAKSPNINLPRSIFQTLAHFSLYGIHSWHFHNLFVIVDLFITVTNTVLRVTQRAYFLIKLLPLYSLNFWLIYFYFRLSLLTLTRHDWVSFPMLEYLKWSALSYRQSAYSSKAPQLIAATNVLRWSDTVLRNSFTRKSLH